MCVSRPSIEPVGYSSSFFLIRLSRPRPRKLKASDEAAKRLSSLYTPTSETGESSHSFTHS